MLLANPAGINDVRKRDMLDCKSGTLNGLCSNFAHSRELTVLKMRGIS